MEHYDHFAKTHPAEYAEEHPVTRSVVVAFCLLHLCGVAECRWQENKTAAKFFSDTVHSCLFTQSFLGLSFLNTFVSNGSILGAVPLCTSTTAGQSVEGQSCVSGAQCAFCSHTTLHTSLINVERWPGLPV